MELKLRNGFPRMSDARLLTRSMQIKTSMDGNANFPNAVPTIADMATCIENFSNAVTDCKSGDRVKIAAKNEIRQTLIRYLHQWSHYVLFESNGNQAKAATSGFDIAPARSPRPPLAKPKALVVSNGINTGELACKGKRVAGAVSYLFEYATLEEMTANSWNRLTSSKAQLVIPSLNRGTLYYLRIGAVGSRGQLVYSDVTSRTAA